LKNVKEDEDVIDGVNDGIVEDGDLEFRRASGAEVVD
jgi:hypothetical protein